MPLGCQVFYGNLWNYGRKFCLLWIGFIGNYAVFGSCWENQFWWYFDRNCYWNYGKSSRF